MSSRTPRARRCVLQACRLESLEQRVLLSISPAGIEFRANSNGFGSQRNAAVAADGDGDFVIAWQSPGDGSGYGIFARKYTSTGGDNLLGSEPDFRVNSFGTGNQIDPAAAMDADGNFVIVWQSAAQDGSGEGIYAQRYNASGVRQGLEFRVNTFTTGNQVSPVVAMDADGDFVIAWTSADQDGSGLGIFAQRYNAVGIPQGGEFQINTTVFHHQFFPSIAMDADGDSVIAWQSYGQDGAENGIYAQRYSASGVAQGSEFRVNTFTTGDQAFASVAMDLSGNFVIAWQSQPQDGSGSGVYAQRFTASSVPLGGEFRVNTTTAGGQGAPAVSMDADGEFLIAWHGVFAGSNDIFAQSFSAAGAPLGTEFRVNTFTTFNQSFPAVAMDHQGDVVVAWASDGQDGSGYGIYAQRYEESPDTAAPVVTDVLVGANVIRAGERLVENPISLILRISEPLTTAGGASGANSANNPANYELTRGGMNVPISSADHQFNFITRMHEVTLAFSSPLAEGHYVLTAKQSLHDLSANALDGDMNGASGGDFVRSFTIAVPAAVGPEFRVNTFTNNHQRLPAIASDTDGNFVIAWQSQGQDGAGYGIYGQRYSAAATPLGSEFRVNSFTTGNQQDTSIAMDADGDFVIVWAGSGLGDESGIFAQRYNAAGVTQGTEFRVNSGTGTTQSRPWVAMRADGDFIVAWESDGQDGSSFGIYARRYNSAGVALGNEFRVNTFTTNAQTAPVVASNHAGDFVIAWNSFTQDGSGQGVYAQIYNRHGLPVFNEFRVNTFTTSAQHSPRIGMDNEGNFVIGWSSSGQDGSGYGVYAQRYTAAGFPFGGEFPVNSTTVEHQFIHTAAMDADGDFVISWHSKYQDGSADGIYAQRYNAEGTPLGGEFLVNTFTTQSQFASAAAMDAGGDFVIAWTSIGQDGSGHGVFAQRFGSTVAAPIVHASSFLFNSAPHRLQFAFNQNVAQSLGTNDIVLQNLTTNQTIPAGQLALTYDSLTNAATFSYTGPGSDVPGVLPDGNYRATLLATGITNAASIPMPQNHVFEFFFLNGDANRDGVVDLVDFNIFAENFGQSPRTFTEGDFTYNGQVNLDDFNILSSRFGAALSSPGFSLPANPFGATRIGDPQHDDDSRLDLLV